MIRFKKGTIQSIADDTQLVLKFLIVSYFWGVVRHRQSKSLFFKDANATT
jgi:hypothetical protein